MAGRRIKSGGSGGGGGARAPRRHLSWSTVGNVTSYFGRVADGGGKVMPSEWGQWSGFCPRLARLIGKNAGVVWSRALLSGRALQTDEARFRDDVVGVRIVQVSGRPDGVVRSCWR